MSGNKPSKPVVKKNAKPEDGDMTPEKKKTADGALLDFDVDNGAEEEELEVAKNDALLGSNEDFRRGWEAMDNILNGASGALMTVGNAGGGLLNRILAARGQDPADPDLHQIHLKGAERVAHNDEGGMDVTTPAGDYTIAPQQVMGIEVEPSTPIKAAPGFHAAPNGVANPAARTMQHTGVSAPKAPTTRT